MRSGRSFGTPGCRASSLPDSLDARCVVGEVGEAHRALIWLEPACPILWAVHLLVGEDPELVVGHIVLGVDVFCFDELEKLGVELLCELGTIEVRPEFRVFPFVCRGVEPAPLETVLGVAYEVSVFFFGDDDARNLPVFVFDEDSVADLRNLLDFVQFEELACPEEREFDIQFLDAGRGIANFRDLLSLILWDVLELHY